MLMKTGLCLSLLLSGGPRLNPSTPTEESAAREWLETLNVLAPDQALVRQTVENWARWRTVTPAARQANLALELRRLRPAQVQNLIELNIDIEFKALSQANALRMKEQIRARWPLDPNVPNFFAPQVKEIRDNIGFRYLRQNYDRLSSGAHPPLVSPRELTKQGLDSSPSFYSYLVDGAPSVDFLIVASKAKPSPHAIEAQLPYTAVVLNDPSLARMGFVLPHFSSPKALIKFFYDWEPELIETLLRQNRMSLPSKVNTAEQFVAYLDSSRIASVFPARTAFQSLSILREALASYVFTEADAKDVLLWAFERWLTLVASNDPEKFMKLQKEFASAVGAQHLFAREFLQQMDLPMFSLRIPVAVGPESYSILRGDGPAHSRPYQADLRRINHDSKP